MLFLLVQWAKKRDNGNPRCTDDLTEPQFADVLAGLAESHHLDKCVDAAFVNTSEAAAENETETGIDAVLNPEDVPADANAMDVDDDAASDKPPADRLVMTLVFFV